VGRTQLHEAWLGATENRIRSVVFVEGFKNNNFLAGIANRQQGGNHRFRGTAADGDFRLRVNRNALPELCLTRNCLAEILCAPGNSILIDVRGNSFLGRALNFRRGRKVRKALCQVDSAMQHGLARHLADYGLGETLYLIAEKVLLLNDAIGHGWSD
jgi:hypothetical protein